MLTKQIFILFKPRQLVLSVYMLLTWSVPKPQNIVSKILPLTSQSDFHWILKILYHIKRLDEKSSQSKNAYYQVLKNPGSMRFLWADLFPFTISQNEIRTENDGILEFKSIYKNVLEAILSYSRFSSLYNQVFK